MMFRPSVILVFFVCMCKTFNCHSNMCIDCSKWDIPARTSHQPYVPLSLDSICITLFTIEPQNACSGRRFLHFHY